MARVAGEAGAHVALNARDDNALKARVAELAAQGPVGRGRAFDVTDHAAAQRRVADLAAAPRPPRYPGGQCRHQPPPADHAPSSSPTFERVLDTNLAGFGRCARRRRKAMIPRERGRIIMTGSISAINARPTISAYVASKGAVHALTAAGRRAGADGITVNCIAPGLLRHRDEHRADRRTPSSTMGVQAHAGGPLGKACGDRSGGGVPGVRRGVLCQRPGDDGRWRLHRRDVRARLRPMSNSFDAFVLGLDQDRPPPFATPMLRASSAWAAR